MPPEFPWFPCYVSDWLSSSRIASMTIAQEGAYHRLLCLAWADKDCSLPADKTSLLSMSKLSTEQSGQLEDILTCFEPHPTLKKRIHNPRLTKEREISQQLHAERSKSGLMGALKRWHGSAIAQPIAPLKQSNSILQSQSHLQKERKNSLKDSESVPHRLEDREGKGFTPLVEEIIKHAPKWPKEIP